MGIGEGGACDELLDFVHLKDTKLERSKKGQGEYEHGGGRRCKICAWVQYEGRTWPYAPGNLLFKRPRPFSV
jgi:hypothetical protein